jgi:hypothetical protein
MVAKVDGTGGNSEYMGFAETNPKAPIDSKTTQTDDNTKKPPTSALMVQGMGALIAAPSIDPKTIGTSSLLPPFYGLPQTQNAQSTQAKQNDAQNTEKAKDAAANSQSSGGMQITVGKPKDAPKDAAKPEEKTA